MKIRVPDYFKEFKCIASECEDTCCAGWQIVIDNETYNKYQKISGKFGERLRSEIVQQDGENIFVLKGNNCSFLNEGKTCDIYTEIGEDSLCYTCRQYPRYMEEFGNLREIGISLSCPEAARIILRDHKKAEFELSETEEEITSYNDINPMIFINLLQCRKVVFDILQNPHINIEDRVSLVLKFANEIQKRIDEENIQGIKAVREKYLDNDFINETVKSLNKYKARCNIQELCKIFKELKHINQNDPLHLDELLMYYGQKDIDEEVYFDKHSQFNKYYEEKMYKFENLLVYFVYRYFMKAVFDYDVAAKVKTAVVSYLMIKELFVLRWMKKGEFTDEDAVDVMHTYSKDIEHLEENIETLAKLLSEGDASFGTLI